MRPHVSLTYRLVCVTQCNIILLPLFWLTNKKKCINKKTWDFLVVFVLFVVNIPLCESAFYTTTKPIENEMKLFKLCTMAFSFSGHVDLYCSDKGENIILLFHDLQVHFRLYV